jgi:hypothetical protein
MMSLGFGDNKVRHVRFRILGRIDIGPACRRKGRGVDDENLLLLLKRADLM